MLYYPTFYEGLEASKNVVYTGQEATQQIIWGLDWAYEKLGARTFYLIGSDYIWPRTSNKIARNHIERYLKKKDPKCRVVGEEYYPLGHTNFRTLINKVKLRRPDLIYSIVGYVWAGIGSTFSVVILLTLFWKRFHGIPALLTIVVGMVFTILWISTGMDAVVTSRLMTFLVALLVAVGSSFLLKPKAV